MTSSTLYRLAAILLAASPLPAFAQVAAQTPLAPASPLLAQPSPLLAPAAPAPAPVAVAAPAPVPVAAAPPAQPMSQGQQAAEQRIAGLQAQLAITQAQAAQWYSVAQIMRDNATATDALFRERAAGVPSMDATTNLESYARVSRAYADGNEKLAAAFQALYGTFSPEQKKAADTMFRQQAAQGAARPAARR